MNLPRLLARRRPPTAPSVRDLLADGFAAQHHVLLSALASVADHRSDSCHGFDADTHPHDFCWSVLHDLDGMVRLPEGASA